MQQRPPLLPPVKLNFSRKCTWNRFVFSLVYSSVGPASQPVSRLSSLTALSVIVAFSRK